MVIFVARNSIKRLLEERRGVPETILGVVHAIHL